MNPEPDISVHDHIQDLITLLLDRAVAAPYALSQPHILVDAYPQGDVMAYAGVRQAITTMAGARAELLDNADHLTDLLHAH